MLEFFLFLLNSHVARDPVTPNLVSPRINQNTPKIIFWSRLYSNRCELEKKYDLPSCCGLATHTK